MTSAKLAHSLFLQALELRMVFVFLRGYEEEEGGGGEGGTVATDCM